MIRSLSSWKNVKFWQLLIVAGFMRADEGTLILNEPFVKFYIAETLMALGDLHKLNFVHRYSHSILHLLNNLEDN